MPDQGRGVIEPLSYHDRSGFSCGVTELDQYFRIQVNQDVRRHAAACFVLLIDGELAGFYTLSAASVPTANTPPELAKKLPRYSVQPVILLGRLAVSITHRGEGWGGLLLLDALRRAYENTLTVGAVAVIVDAKNRKALEFYEHFGFIPLPEPPLRLFLPMEAVRDIHGELS